ncbi:hypothetical protein R6U77_05580 [Lysinibacillus louembei]|uniref:Uncharacterized protein n=1 Tax=Lysinibacillus louembei TaxID=1470088 RepID=A0ABZ0S294_9BACI|nr:hypothetical protein [Lysinibacillus louembei]WPK13158.1 hypothetical protein R6U77_05580 [Lysinibacillus louembei]
MLTIQPTPLLTGARISGDYWDIDQLINAIYHITGDAKRYYDYQGARGRILNVCYKLRQATKGEHHIEYIANGINRGIQIKQKKMIPEKNIYFSVDILWPELLFTAIALNDFIRLHQELIDDAQWNQHIAAVRHFQALVADNLPELIGEEHYAIFLHVLNEKTACYFRYATQYVDVLNLEYLALSQEERAAHLSAFAIRLVVEGEDYQILLAQLMQAAKETKLALHELQISLKYPEFIDW